MQPVIGSRRPLRHVLAGFRPDDGITTGFSRRPAGAWSPISVAVAEQGTGGWFRVLSRVVLGNRLRRGKIIRPSPRCSGRLR